MSKNIMTGTWVSTANCYVRTSRMNAFTILENYEIEVIGLVTNFKTTLVKANHKDKEIFIHAEQLLACFAKEKQNDN